MTFPLVLLNRRRIGGFNPRAILAGSTAIAWFDPSDLSTLFQDAAGTTPVTAPAQPVGLVLDKSRGLVLGPELVTNGDFSSGTTGWVPLTSTLSVVSGALRITATTSATSAVAYTSIPTVAGRTYRFTATLVADAATGNSFMYAGTGGGSGDLLNANLGSTPGTYSYLFTATGSTTFISLSSSSAVLAGQTLDWDNISVRELPGFHASTPSASPNSRPTYGIVPSTGQRNLLTFTEQFDNAAWLKGNTSVSGFTVTTSSASHSLHQIVSVVPGQVYRFSFYAQRGTMSDVKYSVYNRTNNADIVAPTSYYSQINSSGLTRVSFSFTAPAGCVSVNVYPLRDSGVTGTVILGATSFGTQLETGSTASPYQRVVSQFDVTDPVGFPSYPLHYLSFDGVDDFLQTATITPNADKVQVFAGVRKLSDAAGGVVAELSNSAPSNAGSFALSFPLNATDRLGVRSSGSIFSLAGTAAPSLNAPVTSVIRMIGDIFGDNLLAAANGTIVAQSTADQGTGNYLAYPLYIGRRGGTSLAFNGQLYGLITRFSTANLDASLISNTERWMGQKTGVTI